MHQRDDDERAGRESGSPLTTEDLASPAPSGGRDTAIYPGEATVGRNDAADTSAAGPERVGEQADEEPGLGQEQDREQEVVPQAGRDLKTPADEPDSGDEPLLGASEAEGYRTRWTEIQGRFVDEPQEAVRSADTLVAEVMQTFAGRLSEHRSGLEKQWDRGEQVATEDLRQALRAYRSLVNRLLDT